MAKIKYLSSEQTKELYKVIDSDRKLHSVRNRAIIKLGKYCALRASEIGMLKIDDYNTVSQTIFCERLKGSLDNTLRIVDNEVIDAMTDWLEVRSLMVERKGDTPYLFISQEGTPISRKTLDTIFKSYCAKTSIPKDKRHFHVLKHTRAIELGEAGFDIKDIKFWLGHKNVNNTYKYLQYTTAQQRMLYDKLSNYQEHGHI